MQEVFEKIIDKLEKEMFSAELYGDEWNGQTVDNLLCLGNVSDVIEQVVAEYNNGWIPCSERLPKEYGDYLCCDKYGEYIIGFPIERISAEKSFYIETEHEIMNDCIAWQPLPKPYRKENNHEE